MHFCLASGLKLAPTRRRAKELQRFEQVGSLPLQRPPPCGIEAHSLEKTDAPFIDHPNTLAVDLALVKCRRELLGRLLKGQSNVVVEAHDKGRELVQLVQIPKSRLAAAPDSRQPLQRRECVRPDDVCGEKAFELYDIADTLAPTQEPCVEHLEVSLREA